VKAYGEKWLKARPGQGVSTAADEARRLRLHAWPVIGHVLLKEIRTRHIRDLVRGLRSKRVGKKKPNKGAAKDRGLLAPRTVRHVYATLRAMFREAVVDELLSANPCVVKKEDLPAKQDKDPTWRHSAVFTRAEAEQLFSDESIPEDRRVVNALELLSGLRGGEDAALCWYHYDEAAHPLGMLTVALNWDSRLKTVTTPKTEVVRRVPVHPTLAKVLAAWKLGGWERMFGRAPKPDDLIVPNRDGQHRHGQRTIRRFHEDLTRLGLRRRRKHDCRRTFISLARADGARPDILKLVTHGPPRDVMDDYSTIPFEALCTEVAKLRLELRGGQLLQLRQVVGGACDSPCDSAEGDMKKPPRIKTLEAILNEREKGFEPVADGAAEPVQARSVTEHQSVTPVASHPDGPLSHDAVTLSHGQREAIGLALRDTAAQWAVSQDTERLRRDLRALLDALGGGR
jgi:integrase